MIHTGTYSVPHHATQHTKARDLPPGNSTYLHDEDGTPDPLVQQLVGGTNNGEPSSYRPVPRAPADMSVHTTSGRHTIASDGAFPSQNSPEQVWPEDEKGLARPKFAGGPREAIREMVAQKMWFRPPTQDTYVSKGKKRQRH